MHNDPLWKYRHTLIGILLSLVASVFIAALLGAAIGPLFADTYLARALTYAALLLYVVAGAVVLFITLKNGDQQPLSAGRLALWLASLWLWPLLLMRRS